jgi:glycosyltransferase involved in cell wall biosynthesis
MLTARPVLHGSGRRPTGVLLAQLDSMPPPLRVAIVAPTLRILGGQSVQADRLLKAWHGDADIEAWLVPINPVPPRPFRRLLNVKFARTLFTQLFYWPLLVRELRRADVVHVFSASYFSFLLAPLPALLIARWLGKPVILNYRSGEAPDHLARSAIARRALRAVDMNVVPSTFLQDVFRQFGIRANVIPNIVDVDRFAFQLRPRLRPRVVSTRNFEPLYNVACTLKAFELVQRAYPDATLTLVGSGSQDEALRRLAGTLGLRNVQFAGRVAWRDMWRYYAEADIYLQTPDIDNMPGSILEAFASGCAVVATAAGGVPAILGDDVHGCLVPCGDHVAAAERIIGLLEDSARAQRLTTAARESCEEYRWSRVREKWVSLYRAVADSHGPHADRQERPDRPQGRIEAAPSPLRVAIVAPTLRILGGHSVQAARLLRGWENDPQVRAWLVPINPVPYGPLSWLRRIKFARTAATQGTYWPLLFQELRRADVVHIFSASYFSFLLAPLPALIVARLCHKPVVMNYRSGEAPDHLRRSAIARVALRSATANVVPSAFLKRVFAQFQIDTEIIPDIVDLDRFVFRQRTRSRRRLLSTRNFESLYNVACTLRAFAIVQAKYPDATLTLVGSGSQDEALRRLASSLNLRAVHFVGAVQPDDMWRYYDEADIYLQTPDIDNMPGSVLEAFASGCAVVSTEAGGVPAILTSGVHGWLVPCGDHAAAAERVISLIEDPALADRFAVQGRASCERYCWRDVRALWVLTYRRAMGSADIVPAALNA